MPSITFVARRARGRLWIFFAASNGEKLLPADDWRWSPELQFDEFEFEPQMAKGYEEWTGEKRAARVVAKLRYEFRNEAETGAWSGLGGALQKCVQSLL